MSVHRSSTVKVGALAVISICLLVFVMIWLRGRGISSGEQYEVRFNDVDGMREAASVQMMGIRIGFVDLIAPQVVGGKYYVNVKFSINDPSISVPQGSLLSIEQSGIIGEKFLEITPPQLQDVTLATFADTEYAHSIKAKMPVKFVYEDGLLTVGKVERVESFQDENLMRHKMYYRVTLPGARMPEHPLYELKESEDGQVYLLVVSREPILVKRPDSALVFTVEEPVRIKRFLEIQMESAEALKVTNDKITQLLTDETIATLSSTVKNTEVLTARATDVLDSANELFQIASQDMEELVKTSEHLAENLIEVSDNLNEVIGDPQLKDDMLATISSIQESTHALTQIIQDPAMKDTLDLVKDTSKDASELVALLKETAKDKELQTRLDHSLTMLNSSLDKLSVVLGNLDNITDDDDKTIKGIIDDTKATTTNLKTFSEKLNGRFTLFRLMF